MNEPTKLKTTADGVDIYLDPQSGSFVAIIGACRCSQQDVPRPGVQHAYHCKARTISRNNLSALERELIKAAAPSRRIKVI